MSALSSICYLVTGLGVSESSFGSNFKLYPNPTNGNVNIELGAQSPLTEVFVFNSLGQKIREDKYFDTPIISQTISGENGLYLLYIKAGNKSATIWVIKE